MLLHIGYCICFANTTSKANIIYSFLIKCKQVTYIVLAAHLYRMAYGFNIDVVIKVILGKMLGSAISLILYLNSKALYNYLVKLGTIQEKQLIKDVMSLYQLYE